MVKHGLKIGDYVGGRIRSQVDRDGFVGQFEEGTLVVRPTDGSTPESGFDAVVGRLDQMSETEWNSFHIWRTWEGDDVIAKGPAFATDELLPMLGDLFGFYFDVVGPTLLR